MIESYVMLQIYKIFVVFVYVFFIIYLFFSTTCTIRVKWQMLIPSFSLLLFIAKMVSSLKDDKTSKCHLNHFPPSQTRQMPNFVLPFLAMAKFKQATKRVGTLWPVFSISSGEFLLAKEYTI